MRVLIAGVIGGIVMYIWASVAHVATPLASIGLKAMPNEAAAMAVLHQSLGDKPGLYFFPFMHGAASDSKAMAAQEAMLKSNPSGILAYQPPGTPGLAPRQLITEFVLELVESVLAAVVLACAAGFSRRLGIAVVVGIIAGMATNLSYWNWYGFDIDYTLANAFTELMKFVFAGAAIAWVLGWRRWRGAS
jgi:hypothetical protein